MFLYWYSVDIHWRRQWHPTPVLLPGESHGQRSLEGFSPWGRWGSDTTEQLHFHFSLSFIGEGNGNPFQCSCLENPRDGGAWWAAVYGLIQSQIRLKWLSSSSSRHSLGFLDSCLARWGKNYKGLSSPQGLEVNNLLYSKHHGKQLDRKSTKVQVWTNYHPKWSTWHLQKPQPIKNRIDILLKDIWNICQKSLNTKP